MSRLFAVSAGIALCLAAAPAFAQQVAVDPEPPPPPPPEEPLVVATDPYVAPPQPEMYVPYEEPVYVPPPREQPRESTFAFAAASQLNVSGEDGFAPAGWGGTVGFGFIERDGDLPGGVDVAATFLTGKNVSIYDLSIRVVATPKMNGRLLVPYVAFGLCAGASRVVTDRERMTGEHVDYGLGLGPSGSIGLHGFVGDSIYWRAGGGFLGAGVGAVTADLAIGMVVD
jgi:hypothetical protein